MGLLSNKRLEVERVNGKTQVHVVEEFTALGTLAALGVWALVWYHGSTIFEAIAAAGTAALVSILVLVILRCALRLMSEGMGAARPMQAPRRREALPQGRAHRVRTALRETAPRPALPHQLRALLHRALSLLPVETPWRHATTPTA